MAIRGMIQKEVLQDWMIKDAIIRQIMKVIELKVQYMSINFLSSISLSQSLLLGHTMSRQSIRNRTSSTVVRVSASAWTR